MVTEPANIRAARSVHMVGIGGAAMTPLATILLQRGLAVSGSDLCPPSAAAVLTQLGARLSVGHDAANLGNPDILVVSAAVPADNPEIQAARARGIPILKHSAALGQLMRDRLGIAIAGTHGKTTTTAVTAFLLDRGGLDPTFHVGSEMLNYGLFGRNGSGDVLVAEADEFDRRFLDYDPHIAVVTGVEPDHLDYFGTFDQVVQAFEEFASHVRPEGTLVLSADNALSRGLAPKHASRVTYGFATEADWRLVAWRPLGPRGSAFSVRSPEGKQQAFETQLIGRHNAANIAAAVAVGSHFGLPLTRMATALKEFRGTRRRFERVGTARGVTVVDDYAHHPTAIRATLAAARLHFASTIWAVFQPHTAHRTISLFDKFVGCFADADHVFVTPTFRPPGREAESEDPSVAALVGAISHPDVRAATPDEAVQVICQFARDGDLVLVMGAGDICRIEPSILSRLGGHPGERS